ncbi:hypothetical protein FQA39_LY14060 [Lamprigera yunnana]|nr:hypothetical protein FQA39_LY14060 [Lamprigera yunnana]
MKLVILSVLCLSAVAFKANDKQKVILDGWSKLFQPNRNDCIKQSGTSESSINGLFTTLEFPDNYNFKCYLHCQYVKLNFIDDKGNFNLPIMFEQVNLADRETVEECANVGNQESDFCEKVYADVVCGVPKIIAKYN